MEDILVSLFHIIWFAKDRFFSSKNGRRSCFFLPLTKWALYGQDPDGRQCEMCTHKGVAVGYCCTCQGFIDSHCMIYHETICNLKSHCVVRLNQGIEIKISHFSPFPMCKRHADRRAEKYCFDCVTPICRKCEKGHSRKRHRTDWIQNIIGVLDNLNDLKLTLQHIFRHFQRSGKRTNQIDIDYLRTALDWLNATLDIRRSWEDILKIPCIPVIRCMIEKEFRSINNVLTTSDDVNKRMTDIKENILSRVLHESEIGPFLIDLRQHNGLYDSFSLRNAEEGNIRENRLQGFDFQVIDGDDPDRIDSNDSNSSLFTSSSSSSDRSDRSMSVHLQTHNIPDTYMGPITESAVSFDSENLFQDNIQQIDQDDFRSFEKPLTGEIVILQNAMAMNDSE